MPALRRALTVLTCLAIAGGLGAAAFASRGADEGASPVEIAARTEPEIVELARIEVSTVERADVFEDVRLSGSLQPRVTTILNARVGGTIETLTVDVGASVKAGDIVAELDTDALSAEAAAQDASLAALRAQLSLARTVLERNRQLGRSGITSEAALLEAEANVLNLEAQMRGLEAQLAEIRRQIGEASVRAPFDGVVSARAVNAGQTVAPNAELMTIVDLSTVEMNAAVPTSRIAAVEIGQTASFRVEGFGDQAFAGTVSRISPVAEAGSRAVRVFFTIENESAQLRGGMFATGTLRIQEHPDVIALPVAAIRRDETGTFVLKAEDGHLRRQGVETGAEWPDRGLIEVAAGLSDGDVVVTAPLPDLVPDVEIRIAEL